MSDRQRCTRALTRNAWAAALAVALAWSGAGPAPASAQVAAQRDAATQPAADSRTSPTRMSPAGLSYGPVLTPRNGANAQSGQAARRDPAEVRDETDTPARQAAPGTAQSQQAGAPASAPSGTQPPASSAQGAQPHPQLTDKQQEEQRRRAARRRPAYQGERPMAPRPLRPEESPQFVAEPVPAPLPAPRPVVPSSNAVRACQGIACTDAAGNTFNGSGNAGVGSGGRMCARTGATVQCF